MVVNRINQTIVVILLHLLLPNLLFTGCSATQSDPEVEAVIYADFTKSIKNYDISFLIDPICSIIALETTNESLIGSIDKIEIKENNIYILDIIGNAILKFDDRGNYISKLSSVGQGPGEYIGITDMTITDSSIIILDRFSLKQIKYDLKTFSFISEEQVLKEIWATSIFNLSNTLYYMNDGVSSSGKFRLFKWNEEKKSFDKYLKEKASIMSLGTGNYNQQYTINKDKVLLVYNGYDYIYEINKDSVYSKYKIHYENGKVIYGDRVETVFRDNAEGLAIGIETIRKFKDYIVLRIAVTGPTDYYCLFNMESKETIICEHLTSITLDNEHISMNFHTDNKIIDCCEASDLLVQKEYLSDKMNFKNEDYGQKLESVLSTIEEDDNPVLFIYKVKED